MRVALYDLKLKTDMLSSRDAACGHGFMLHRPEWMQWCSDLLQDSGSLRRESGSSVLTENENAGKLKRDNRQPNVEGKVSISTPLNRGRDDGCHETDTTTVIMQMD